MSIIFYVNIKNPSKVYAMSIIHFLCKQKKNLARAMPCPSFISYVNRKKTYHVHHFLCKQKKTLARFMPCPSFLMYTEKNLARSMPCPSFLSSIFVSIYLSIYLWRFIISYVNKNTLARSMPCPSSLILSFYLSIYLSIYLWRCIWILKKHAWETVC